MIWNACHDRRDRVIVSTKIAGPSGEFMNDMSCVLLGAWNICLFQTPCGNWESVLLSCCWIHWQCYCNPWLSEPIEFVHLIAVAHMQEKPIMSRAMYMRHRAITYFTTTQLHFSFFLSQWHYCRGVCCTFTGQMTWIRGGPHKVDGDNIRHAVDSSLQRLGTDYIDIIHIHWPDRWLIVRTCAHSRLGCEHCTCQSMCQDTFQPIMMSGLERMVWGYEGSGHDDCYVPLSTICCGANRCKDLDPLIMKANRCSFQFTRLLSMLCQSLQNHCICAYVNVCTYKHLRGQRCTDIQMNDQSVHSNTFQHWLTGMSPCLVTLTTTLLMHSRQCPYKSN